MKKVKRMIAAALCGAVALGAASCGNGDLIGRFGMFMRGGLEAVLWVKVAVFTKK